MKTINKDELYQHLGDFLKSKGVELKDGSYAKRIQQSCGLLSDAINLGQAGIEKAKAGTGKKIDQLRQVIHDKTAPKAPPAASRPTPPPTAKAQPRKAKPAPKTTAGKSAPSRPAKPTPKA
jgi:hypothetical protein